MEKLTRRFFLAGAISALIVPTSFTQKAVADTLTDSTLTITPEEERGLLNDLYTIYSCEIPDQHWKNLSSDQKWERIYSGDVRGQKANIEANMMNTPDGCGFTIPYEYYIGNITQETVNQVYNIFLGRVKIIVSDSSKQENIVSSETDFETSIQSTQQEKLDIFAKKYFQDAVSIDEKGVEHTFTGKPKDIPSPYNHSHFYGNKKLGENISGTYINAQLQGVVPESISENETTLIVDTYNGKTYVAGYERGKLTVLSYVSPGESKHKTPATLNGQTFRKLQGENLFIDMNKVSVQGKGSSMWGAIQVDGGIFFHSSALGIDGKGRSHGCFRTPLLYLNGIHQMIGKLSNGEALNIQINKIYG